MATKTAENEVMTYRVVPTGDGRYFTWKKFDAEGEEVDADETASRQVFTSEADAEKFVRGNLLDGNDILAVTDMKSVDAEDNTNVVYETSEVAVSTKNGAAIKAIEADSAEGDNDRPVEELTVAQKAVNEGVVAPADVEVERPAAEQKAVDAATAKAEKAEKESK